MNDVPNGIDMSAVRAFVTAAATNDDHAMEQIDLSGSLRAVIEQTGSPQSLLGVLHKQVQFHHPDLAVARASHTLDPTRTLHLQGLPVVVCNANPPLASDGIMALPERVRMHVCISLFGPCKILPVATRNQQDAVWNARELDWSPAPDVWYGLAETLRAASKILWQLRFHLPSSSPEFSQHITAVEVLLRSTQTDQTLRKTAAAMRRHAAPGTLPWSATLDPEGLRISLALQHIIMAAGYLNNMPLHVILNMAARAIQEGR